MKLQAAAGWLTLATTSLALFIVIEISQVAALMLTYQELVEYFLYTNQCRKKKDCRLTVLVLGLTSNVYSFNY